MSHLSTDRLAALVDEPAAADEQHHLRTCEQCARELEAHRSLLAMAGHERDAMQLPLTRWDSLATRLRREGLITSARGRQGVGRRIWSAIADHGARVPLQAAAALLLIASGVVMGRLSTSASPFPGGIGGSQTAQTAKGRITIDSLPTSFASLDDATRWKNAYADAYQGTVSFLAANDSGARTGTPAVIRARLSALDRVSRTMREALNDAPYDPVINDFYLNSFGQREATLRQLNTVLPQGVRMNSF